MGTDNLPIYNITDSEILTYLKNIINDIKSFKYLSIRQYSKDLSLVSGNYELFDKLLLEQIPGIDKRCL